MADEDYNGALWEDQLLALDMKQSTVALKSLVVCHNNTGMTLQAVHSTIFRAVANIFQLTIRFCHPLFDIEYDESDF